MTQKSVAVAQTFAQRAAALGMTKLTYEREFQPGGKQRYAGLVKACIDTLRENGIEFVQMARKPGQMQPDYVTPVKGWRAAVQSGASATQKTAD